MSEDTKRVGVLRGRAAWIGEEKCRYLAAARLRSTDAAEVGSSEIVGITALSDAIACRRSNRGSWMGAAMLVNAHL